MYTGVESRFWQDEKMRTLSADAKYLMLYLLTSPHRTLMGFYFLPKPYACFDLGWETERFSKPFRELIDKGLIKYDETANVVLIQNFLKHNPIENPNQVKSALARLSEIPQTQLFQDFSEIIQHLNKPFMKPLQERLSERLLKQEIRNKKEEIRNKNIDVCPEQAPAKPPIFEMPLNNSSLYPIYQEDIGKWRDLYPAVDVEQEIKKMIGWLDANPTKRKTKNGIKRFINGWLAKEQDKGKGGAIIASPTGFKPSRQG